MGMVPNLGGAPNGDIFRPECTLATLMQGEMRMGTIDPVVLRLFLLAHWDNVSRLAHQIHATGPKNPKAERG